MPRYVVLLRGINLGRARRLAMADLQALLADAGYTDVRTHLNSGNALVTGPEADPAEHAARIAGAIDARLGMDVPCVVLTAADLGAIVDDNPFLDVLDDGSKMMVHVLSAVPDPALVAEQDPVAADPERARLVGRVLYQWCPDGLMAAPAVGFDEKRAGLVVTARNWNTITKLHSLL